MKIIGVIGLQCGIPPGSSTQHHSRKNSTETETIPFLTRRPRSTLQCTLASRNEHRTKRPASIVTKAHGRPVGVSGCTKDNIHWKSLSVYGSVMRLLQVSSARGESACDWRPTAKHFHLVTDERLTVRPPLRLVGPLRVEANRTTRGADLKGFRRTHGSTLLPTKRRHSLPRSQSFLS